MNVAIAATVQALVDEADGDPTYAYLLVFVQPGNYFCGPIPNNVSAVRYGVNPSIVGGADFKYIKEVEGEAEFPACDTSDNI